ncbi:PD-(D/E)XK nuclease family protein [Gillisia sp. M10.2A]|uniref:PD-(D/E)XK nuclease family protein n=1 Tax=Gillisia lutea TaxID=2909668 RepID=A0ABS9EGL5_9FLAO|nr:PD-(D/E)XK nuclease family protein [Gillisia lutea]MCF4100563.1 PD-(D/E)XK nuclease family protein [Gillisia lutea]
MTSFLSHIIKELLDKHSNISNFNFVLPSKRAGSFLKKEISNFLDQPVFSPNIISIEEFAESVSGLETIDSITTLFEFYEVYKTASPKEDLEDFDNFSTWAQTLIHDFNEIDRYLIDPNSIFNYLSEIQDINHWYLQEEKTDLVKNYLKFWKKLPAYYASLKTNLLEKHQAYQGLVYREASEKIEEFALNSGANYIFIGFNALNAAEQLIIQKMLDHGAQIFWDIDEVHFHDQNHDASLFIRDYAASWPYYKTNTFNHISSNYAKEKNIELIGIPKNVGQAKYVGEILSNLPAQDLSKTALVLGDETLLLPMLNSLPENISALNITMGYPLKYSPFSSLFDKLFELSKIENDQFYYKDVISILSNSAVKKATQHQSDKVISIIRKENLLYLSKAQILSFINESDTSIFQICFSEKAISPIQLVKNLLELVIGLKEYFKEDGNALSLEFLFHYHEVFEHLEELLNSFTHIKSITSLHHFYKELSSSQTLDFQGKPFQGLQLMGMLESRVLDFETIILTSVNEGTLPAGKSNNSFIPYELKKTFNLPTYKEKDAVYTYHFYHLLQRAKKVYLLHDTDTESQMGGEKSRFLLQLEVEKQALHNIHNSVVVPEVPKIENSLQSIPKTPEIMERLKELAKRGFSPSALTTYIRNPLDFYKQYILSIRDKDEVEETVAHNTLGTVVHATLEAFYMPLKGRTLELAQLEEFKKQIALEVTAQFQKEYSKVPLSKGKNLLILEVVKRYVSNFLNMEMEEIKSGNIIRILEIESNLTAEINIPELNFPVIIRGNVDRVDEANGILRIIDYKTGKVMQNQLEILDWDELTTDYDKYAKPFQVLMYATMLLKNKEVTSPVEAGVISFKNLKPGFLKFAKKDKPRDKDKDSIISAETLENFQQQLKALILEICNPDVPFVEKEIKSNYGNY